MAGDHVSGWLRTLRLLRHCWWLHDSCAGAYVYYVYAYDDTEPRRCAYAYEKNADHSARVATITAADLTAGAHGDIADNASDVIGVEVKKT